MTGTILKKISSQKLITFIIQLDEGGNPKVNIVPTFRNAVHWIDLEPGDKVTGLKWKEMNKIIDGDSPVERV